MIQQRKPLFQVTSLTVNGSHGFGVFATGGHSRLVGAFSSIGSLTLTTRSGVASGGWQVSSASFLNSGSNIVDLLNYSRFTDLSMTAAASAVVTGGVVAEVSR